MRKLHEPVRRDASAVVQGRIDERCESARALHRVVDVHPHLTQVGQIRSEPGGGNDPVVRTDLPVSGPEHNTVGAAVQFMDPEAGHKPDLATLYEPTGIAAKLSTLRQLIVRPTSEDRRGIGTSGHPRDLGVRAGFGQRGEVADGVLGRVTATHDHGPQPLEPASGDIPK
jgi:hypothetical protein